VKTKLIGYHFRAHPKFDPHHFVWFFGVFFEKNAEFQPKIVCKPSNIDVALIIKDRRGSAYRQQQRIPTSIFQGRSGAYGRTKLQRHKQRNTCIEKCLIVCQSCRRQWVIVPKGNMCRNPSCSVVWA
jgi:hypothetical protein